MPKVPPRIDPKRFLPQGYTPLESTPPRYTASELVVPKQGIPSTPIMVGSPQMSQSMMIPSGSGTKPGIDWKNIANKVQRIGNDVAPFISNIANAFKKPPMPKAPYLNSFTNLSKVNLDNDRNTIERSVNTANVSVDRNLPNNAAAAIKANNLGTKLNQLSSVSEREQNANTQIGNQQAQMDMQTQAGNNSKMEDYNDSLVERQIAQQREQSQNLSNAADKYIGIRNEKDKANVALQQTQMMSHAFDNSQVMGRLRWKAKQAGEADPLGRDYKDLDKSPSGTPIFKMGGKIPSKKLY